MQITEKKVCSFFGHRLVFDDDGSLSEQLLIEIGRLVNCGYTEFLLGSYGGFDRLAYSAINNLKKKHLHIKTVYVRACHIQSDEKVRYLRKQYDEIAYPEIGETSKRLAIVYRNREMIKQSDCCIFYAKYSRGGIAQALEFAKSKNKPIINLAQP